MRWLNIEVAEFMAGAGYSPLQVGRVKGEGLGTEKARIILQLNPLYLVHNKMEEDDAASKALWKNMQLRKQTELMRLKQMMGDPGYLQPGTAPDDPFMFEPQLHAVREGEQRYQIVLSSKRTRGATRPICCQSEIPLEDLTSRLVILCDLKAHAWRWSAERLTWINVARESLEEYPATRTSKPPEQVEVMHMTDLFGDCTAVVPSRSPVLSYTAKMLYCPYCGRELRVAYEDQHR